MPYRARMKKILLLLFFSSLTARLLAQPGPSNITKNINDVTANDIEQISSPSLYQYTFVIDSSSNLSKLDMLNSLYSIRLRVRLHKVPKEISLLSARLNEVDIYCFEPYPIDISTLQLLKNLTKLRINGDF